MGIYNCRSVRGSATTSLHGEGRAYDLGWPMVNGRGTASGEEVVRRLGSQGRRLGIQCIIYNRKIYSATSPRGRNYTGVHPHYDHLHIELTRASGAQLNLATLRDVLGSTRVVEPTQPTDPPVTGDDVLKRGDESNAVGVFMRAISRWAFDGNRREDPLPRSRKSGKYGDEDQGFDNIFGPEMEEAVKLYQRAAGVNQSGQIDGVTAALLVRYDTRS
jgi:hypothetical protein